MRGHIKLNLIASFGKRLFGGAQSLGVQLASTLVFNCMTITFGTILAPHPRVIKAYNAMRSLGISDEEVKPVLKNLLQLYDRNWELIEEDNYRTLIDAYFELKEAKVCPNILCLFIYLNIDLINCPFNCKFLMC